MSQFQILAGDTDRFALWLSFARDPDEGGGASGEESASWGSFRIWANGRNLCAHWEQGEQVDSVSWYLLPLLEWLCSKWDYLLHETKLPIEATEDDAQRSLRRALDRFELTESDERQLYEWRQRHALLTCRQGGLFPDIVFRRLGADIEISWGETAPAGAPSHFRFFEGSGKSLCDPSLLAQSLQKALCEAVAFLLQSKCSESHRLLALRDSLAKLSALENTPRRLALLAGLGDSVQTMMAKWKIAADRIRSRLRERADAFLCPPQSELVVQGSCDAVLMFGTASPRLSDADVLALADSLVESYSPDAESPLLKSLASTTNYHGSPWDDGYLLAEGFLAAIQSEIAEFQASGTVEVDHVLEQLGIAVKEAAFEDAELRAVAMAGPQHSPQIVLNLNHQTNTFPSGRRFTLAHELCHILYDRSYGSSLAIVSGSWAPVSVEKRANAFAAMLLMPMPLLQRHMAQLRHSFKTSEGIAELSKMLAVSYTSLVQHLRNLGYLDWGTADLLLNHADS